MRSGATVDSSMLFGGVTTDSNNDITGATAAKIIFKIKYNKVCVFVIYLATHLVNRSNAVPRQDMSLAHRMIVLRDGVMLCDRAGLCVEFHV